MLFTPHTTPSTAWSSLGTSRPLLSWVCGSDSATIIWVQGYQASFIKIPLVSGLSVLVPSVGNSRCSLRPGFACVLGVVVSVVLCFVLARCLGLCFLELSLKVSS